MKHILATEQKKTDFRPEDENNVMIQYTTVRSHAKPNKLEDSTDKSSLSARKWVTSRNFRVKVSRSHFPACPPPQACSKVGPYVSRQVEHVRKSMDGKNVDTVLTEFGVRFHRLIHEHLQQYSYSSMGGMLAICDVAEYRRCAKDFRVSEGGGGRGRGWVQEAAKI